EPAQRIANPFDRNGTAGHGSDDPRGSGVKVLSLHHDISTVTGEEVVLFTLTKSPAYRQPNK
ncbi:MAG: hypothetical protein ACLQVF_00255, partial [Isosphaeraceae bacterium]